LAILATRIAPSTWTELNERLELSTYKLTALTTTEERGIAEATERSSPILAVTCSTLTDSSVLPRREALRTVRLCATALLTTRTPTEQHVHSFLEMLPLTGLLIVVTIHWQQFLALFGLGGEGAVWTLHLKKPPLPWLYVSVILWCSCSKCFHIWRSFGAGSRRVTANVQQATRHPRNERKPHPVPGDPGTRRNSPGSPCYLSWLCSAAYCLRSAMGRRFERAIRWGGPCPF
jgi:hypothetical protein